MHLGARYYWPEVGRFGQRDPVPSTYSQYGYANCNPSLYADPTGLRVPSITDRVWPHIVDTGVGLGFRMWHSWEWWRGKLDWLNTFSCMLVDDMLHGQRNDRETCYYRCLVSVVAGDVGWGIGWRLLIIDGRDVAAYLIGGAGTVYVVNMVALTVCADKCYGSATVPAY